MKPPPPMLPALGCVTASANAVATAASTAEPPFASTAAPVSHAGADVHTTSPSLDGTPVSGAATTASRAGSASTATTRTRTRRRIGAAMGAAYHPDPILQGSAVNDADLARRTVSHRCDLRPARHKFFGVLRGGDGR